ncbi:hypothetical protein [Microbacterium sp. RG1]|uniref:hypothetical protein n=1 Tax=Microbacterium sp. RG1 TaxID=2489212 RepID=UPI0010CA484C|nr:hypothetical protein [Microbacterium sp. RG1]QCQ17970.1 hypothetical protein EHF32_15270 [Microbacterium sp. RG1]
MGVNVDEKHVPGVPAGRGRQALSVVASGVFFALASAIVVFAPVLETGDPRASFRDLMALSHGFRETAIATLGFIGSGVLVLRITYAIGDRRAVDHEAYAEAEQRFSTVAAVASMLAVWHATLALPSALTGLDEVGTAAAIVAIVLLTLLFAFTVGASWAPGARRQREVAIAERDRARARAAAAGTLRLRSPAWSILEVLAWIAVTGVLAPAGLGFLAIRLVALTDASGVGAPVDAGYAMAIAATAATIGAASWYGILIAQFGRYLGAGVLAVLARVAGAVFAMLGWVALVLASASGWMDSRWGGWVASGILFLVLGVLAALASLWRGGESRFSPVTALRRMFVGADRRAVERSEERIRLLDARIHEKTLVRAT